MCLTDVEKLNYVQQFHSLEETFDAIDQLVKTRWREAVFDPENPNLPMNRALTDWQVQLEGAEGGKEQLAYDLSNLEMFDVQFSMRQFGYLGGLQEKLPDAWLSLLGASSERQLAKIAVAKEWFKFLSDEQVHEFGFQTKGELEYLLLLQALTGKYVDQAYIKQVLVTDTEDPNPPNEVESDLHQFAYSYTAPDSGNTKIISFGDVYRFDYQHVGHNFNQLSKKVDLWIQNGTLPPSYQMHVVYLNELAELYGDSLTENSTHDTVGNRWIDAFKIIESIIEDGQCPIVPIFQSTPSLGDKVDNEIRFGIATPKSKAINLLCVPYAQKAQEINEQLGEHTYKVTRPIALYTISTFGANLFWEVRGEADPGIIFLHPNAIEAVAEKSELPLAKKILKSTTDDDSFLLASVKETARHEIAHQILSPEDNLEIRSAFSSSPDSSILDEIKAETVGAQLISQNELNDDGILEATVSEKLGTLLDYLAHKDNEDYTVPAGVIFQELLNKNLISFSESGENLLVKDNGGVIDSIALIGNSIIELYQRILNTSSPEDRGKLIEDSITSYRKSLEDPRIIQLINLSKQN
jgi:hypothetical protein